MTTQLSMLPVLPAARRRDPETSKEAARQKAHSARSECGLILAVLSAADEPLTFREVARATGLDPVAAMRRLSWDLIREGKVRKDRRRRCTTLGGGGRKMVTWRLA